MAYVNVERLLKSAKNIFKLVTLAYERVLELSNGSKKLVDYEDEDLANVALKEIEEGKVFINEDE